MISFLAFKIEFLTLEMVLKGLKICLLKICMNPVRVNSRTQAYMHQLQNSFTTS